MCHESIQLIVISQKNGAWMLALVLRVLYKSFRSLSDVPMEVFDGGCAGGFPRPVEVLSVCICHVQKGRGPGL